MHYYHICERNFVLTVACRFSCFDNIVIFKRPQVQVVQPTELFNMTKAKPMLYYKAVKEPPAPASPKETDAPAPQVAEAN